MRVVEYILDEEEEQSGVNAVSLVDEPAIESDWVMLSKQTKIELKETSQRGVLMGALLIPDLPIMRKDEEGNEYYIYFSKATLRKVLNKFMKTHKHSNVTLGHKIDVPEGQAYLTEIWEKEDDVHDKSVMYGIDAPIGSLIGSMKVESEELLNLAKEGKINGFSIEGLFSDKAQFNKIEHEISDADLADEIIELIKNVTKVKN